RATCSASALAPGRSGQLSGFFGSAGSWPRPPAPAADRSPAGSGSAPYGTPPTASTALGGFVFASGGQRASSRAGPCGTTAPAYPPSPMVPGRPPGPAAQGTPVRTASGDTYTTLTKSGKCSRTGPHTSSRTLAGRSGGTVYGGAVRACRHIL